MTNNKLEQSNIIDSTNLIAFIYKRRKILIIIGIVAVIVSSIVSFIIEPKYKSTVIMFPAKTNSVSKALLSEDARADDDILKFGEEEEAEQMLQVLNSSEIRSRICQKYNLLKHYDINSDDQYKNTKLFETYKNNINFERTEFMSVKIEVLDKDPQMAADIANDISSLLDSISNKMQNERAMQGLKIVEQQYIQVQQEVKVIEDSLNAIRKLGINDYETQAAAYNEQYATAIAKGMMQGIPLLEEKLKILSQYGGAYVSLSSNLGSRLKYLNTIKTKYEQAQVDANQSLPHKFIVDKAYKAEKKAYPIRWLIVVLSTISSLLFTIIIIIIMENISKIRN